MIFRRHCLSLMQRCKGKRRPSDIYLQRGACWAGRGEHVWKREGEGREGEVGDSSRFLWIPDCSQNWSESLVAPDGQGQSASVNKSFGPGLPSPWWPPEPGNAGVGLEEFWGSAPPQQPLRQMPNRRWLVKGFRISG